MLKRVVQIVFAVAAFAMVLNLIGLFVSPVQTVAGPKGAAAPDRRMQHGSLFRRPGEPDAAYFRRLTLAVHSRITYSKKPYRVPLTENWVLATAGLVNSSFANYDFADYRKGLARGAGLCTQYAAVVFDVLKRQGYRRQMIVMGEHALVEAETRRGRPWLLDAAYGATVAHRLEEVRRDVLLTVPAYLALNPSETPFPKRPKLGIADEAKRSFQSPILFRSSEQPTPNRAGFEPVAYDIKWWLPALLLVLTAPFTLRKPRLAPMTPRSGARARVGRAPARQ